MANQWAITLFSLFTCTRKTFYNTIWHNFISLLLNGAELWTVISSHMISFNMYDFGITQLPWLRCWALSHSQLSCLNLQDSASPDISRYIDWKIRIKLLHRLSQLTWLGSDYRSVYIPIQVRSNKMQHNFLATQKVSTRLISISNTMVLSTICD